ncbi:MAG: CusA/CzcA family heavy metal efflux RND transporter [Terrimonas sp.]|nr:CusA/CzcA family heavy metal efflux RND transporter [Terrimonas sp.]OJY98083.1 MAG: acriflavine resistance protein B [Sphingobacteriales bacterium 40-81]
MLNSIIRFSIRNKLIIGLFTIALIIAGVINLARLPVDALPDITSNQVQIITVSPTLAAPEVERLITFPLEQANANIPGLKEIRSISRFGLSVITIVFDDDIDVYWARQQVSERLNLAKEQIPASAGNPELAPVTTGIGEVYQYVLRPKKGFEEKYNLTELRSIQDWIVRRQLLGTPGVADVSSFGGFLKQYEVAVQTDRLKSMNITIADIFAAIEKNNQNSGGAYIEKGPNALFIRTEGMVKTIEELGNVFVKHTGAGVPLFLKDVADVRIGHAIRYGAITYKNEGEVAGAVVLMLKGANATEVIKNIKSRIAQIKTTLPEGVILEVFYDRTKMVDSAIHTVSNNLMEGALIVILILVLFLGNMRAGLIVASVIPLAMLFAIIMMNLFGVSGNLMSLGALDFGLIVDGAVIIVEAVLHRLFHGKGLASLDRLTQQQLDHEVENASSRMMTSAAFGQIIILIVYLPILTLTGIEGKMFKPMAQTVSFALIGAFLLSLTYVPMMTALCLNKKISHKKTWSDKMMAHIEKVYTPVLNGALKFPKMIVAAALLLFVVALLLVSRLGGEFIPELNEGDFAVDARLMAGSSLTETINTTQKGVDILQKRFPEVEKIVTRIGASEIPTDPMPIEVTDIMISLKPQKEWTSAKTFDELADKMSAALQEVPGMTSGFQFPVQMRFNELISGAKQDIVCKIFGENLDSLAAYAGKLGELTRKINGTRDIYVEAITGLPQIVVRYKQDAMAHYQLTVAEINQLIRTAFAGESAGLVYEEERRYDIAVRLQNNARKDIKDIRELLIPTPMGTQVPLYQVADINIEEGPNQIQREDAKRRIIVGFNVRGRDVESVVNELSDKAGRGLALPSGYYIKYGGQFQNLVEAKQRLYITVPAALLLILIMLYFALGSIKQGLLIFSAIPLSAIGGIFALWIRGMPFSISAGVGFIALFGVAVLNGIVLITEFNRLKKSGLQEIKHIIMQGTHTRLRPVLMTAGVASLGFLPMAVSQSAGAEVQRPLATVVIGGLITATMLTLLVLPVLYMWFEKIKSKPNIITAAPVFIGLLICCSTATAQQHQTLDEVLKRAEENNLSLQSATRLADYWKQLQTGVFDPPKTQVGAEYGAINSMQNDTRLFAGQAFALPVVYRSHRNLYNAQEQLQRKYADWKKAEIEKEVRTVFFQLADIMERKKLLQELDTVYSRFAQAATLRLNTGESNVLEKTTADAQLQQLQLQMQYTASDIKILQQRLQVLLNTEDWIQPQYDSPKMSLVSLPDTGTVSSHPQVAFNLLEEKVAAASIAVENAKLSPEFSVAYNNQSIIGYQSPDGVSQKYYDAGHRFHFVNITVDVPLFNRAAKARIKAVKVNEDVAKINTKVTEQNIRYSINQLLEEYNKQQNSLHYYEKAGLKQAGQIIISANLSFKNGEISYLEWTMLMNNAVNIRLGYIEAIKQYNLTLIELNYLTAK